MALQQVNHLVDENELEAGKRLLCQFKVDPDATCVIVAASPLRLHPSYSPVGHPDTDLRLPLCHQLRYAFPKQLTIPVVKHVQPAFAASSRSNAQL
jgi:hypothetical protein